jgi:hypothetical protein
MNIAEKYALECGLKLDKPFIDLSFFPVKNDKYILLDFRTEKDAERYDYIRDIVEIIFPICQKNGIDVLQLAEENYPKIPPSSYFVGLPKRQEAFLIKNALLTISLPNLTSYLSAHFNVWNISLHSIYHAATKAPIWNREKQIILESHRDGNLPGYGIDEQPKTINFIYPERVIEAALQCLGIHNPLHNNIDVIHIGSEYKDKVVEIVPDFISSPDFLKGKAVNIRLDCHYSIENLSYWIEGRSLNIISDKEIPLDFVKNYKQNIQKLVIYVDKMDVDYLKSLKSLGINTLFYSTDKENISALRLRLFDFDVFLEEPKTKKNIDFPEKIDSLITYYTSNKFTFARGKRYSSKAAWKAGVELDQTKRKVESIIDSPDFWAELDHYKLFNIKNIKI